MAAFSVKCFLCLSWPVALVALSDGCDFDADCNQFFDKLVYKIDSNRTVLLTRVLIKIQLHCEAYGTQSKEIHEVNKPPESIKFPVLVNPPEGRFSAVLAQF